MQNSLTRRTILAMTLPASAAAARPNGLLIDTHIHLFAKDRKRFPLHANAPYDPRPRDLEDYRAFVKEAAIDHAVIVHPEPYQDDHSYLEHCFANEPSSGFFKGTCLFDPARDDTPRRIAGIVKKHGERIVAMRIHALGERGARPMESGAIKNRDLTASYMHRTWQAAADAGIAIQMHFKPFFAPQIGRLKAQFPSAPVVLDHLGRNGMGNPADFFQLLDLAKRPNVHIKFSGYGYSSNEEFPHRDLKPVVRRIYESFGPGRMIWGGLGHSVKDFERNSAMLDETFDYASESERRQIRGLTAKKLFGF